MDAKLAVSLASSIDPKALASLQNRNNDPAVAKAVAGQFGAFLMQGMLQEGDGTALSMAGGTGGPAVNAMFASAMSRYAMSGDKLGLADMIYRSTAGKTQDAAPQTGAAAPAQALTAPAGNKASPSPPESGLSLMPYRLGNGHRPLGPAMGRMTPPAGSAVAKAAVPLGQDGTLAGTGAAKTAPAEVPANRPIAAAAAKTSPQTEHSFWNWLGVSSLLHLVFPSHQTPPLPQAATAASPAAGAAVPGSGVDSGAIPYGLPWTHRHGGPETGAPNRPDADHAAKAGTVAAMPTDAEQFAQNLAPALEQAGRRLGVSPRVLLAQAALETGWGHSVVGNNIFGIKAGASWSGATVAANTHEMTGGRLVAHRDSFRSYDSVGQAVDDYVALVSASDRYRAALGAGDDAATYARALTGGGYATDRDYAAKLTAVANSAAMSNAVAPLDGAESGRLVSARS
jgi:flagellar protein FlgJ